MVEGRENPIGDAELWIDPEPDSKGLLLSDRIVYYVKRVKLIEPFDPKYLRPASYTLRAGATYILNNREGNLAIEGSVSIPPNGLIYIQFLEELNIPYYMIARFNLRVKQVYRGLLLGTGPQVDPGFKGHLFCPIHNFTDEDKQIKYREELGTIDFEKTTRFGEVTLNEGARESLNGLRDSEIRRRYHEVQGRDGELCLVFPPERRDRPLRDYLPGGESVQSSVYQLQREVRRFARELSRFRSLSFWGAIVGGAAILAIPFALAGFLLSLHVSLEDDVKGMRRELSQEIRALSQAVGRLEGAIARQVMQPREGAASGRSGGAGIAGPPEGARPGNR